MYYIHMMQSTRCTELGYDRVFLFQLKFCGFLCLCSCVLCVVVTVTTTVIHMNRLQTLRECLYQTSSKTCTCFASIVDPISKEGNEEGLGRSSQLTHNLTAGLHYIFAGTASCDVIHGVLYSSLRALFGVSVIGILATIFSCMLVYQLMR